MIKKLKMEDCKPVLTLMVIGWKLSIDDSSMDVDQRLYISMIGSLLYVTASQPDVMQAIGQVEDSKKNLKNHILLLSKEFFDL